ncbi:hypothetical protein DPMN_006261 [Dreissena polymorpha]|uniref:Secreted protein n=1 Tax=Dreissena polymorpha TaxID=45954 RepID=A0A9D4MUX9_DREPO|nr:hypothetical protein DPMN_006261 [Dreissena polymorpha]
MLSSFTASLLIAARRSASAMVATSRWRSRIMSVRRSELQQYNRAVGGTLSSIAIPTLYMSHCRVNADHWSGSHPAAIVGGSNFSLCGATGFHGSGAQLLSQPQMLHPGLETANHILLLGTVTAACWNVQRPLIG